MPLLSRIACCLLLGFLFSCKEPSPPPPPGQEEVFAIQDSIREEILLRISNAQMEVNRQTEMMGRRAYDASPALARQLKRKINDAEASYRKLEALELEIKGDSLLGDWIMIQQQAELLFGELSRTLNTPL